MSTRELLEIVERDPSYLLTLIERDDQLEERADRLCVAGILAEKWVDMLFRGYILTADGRDLLHGASERRLSA